MSNHVSVQQFTYLIVTHGACYIDRLFLHLQPKVICCFTCQVEVLIGNYFPFFAILWLCHSLSFPISSSSRAMCDNNGPWGCRCHGHPMRDQHGHCQFEEYHQTRDGPLHRTSTSSSRGCHQCNHDSQRHCCNNNSQDRHILNNLETLLSHPRRDSDLTHILDRLSRDHRDTDNREVLERLLDGLARNNDNRNNRSNRASASSNDHDVLVDLLLRITSNNNTNNTSATTLDTPPPYHPYPRRALLDDAQFMSLQNARPGFQMPFADDPYSSYPNAARLYEMGRGTGIPSAATPWMAWYVSRGQVPPRWPGRLG